MKALLVLALVLAAAAPAMGQSVSLPFEMDHGLMVVHIKVDATPATMIIDTGSKSTFFNDPTSHDNIRPNSAFMSEVHHENVLIRVSSDYCTSMTVARVSTAAISKFMGHRIDGILGTDFLSGFSQVRIDFKAHVIEARGQ